MSCCQKQTASRSLYSCHWSENMIVTNNNLLFVHISTKIHKKVAKWECWSSDPSHVYFHTAAVISPTHNLLWWKNIRRVRLEIKAESNFQKKLDCSEEEVCCCHCCVIIGQSCHFWAVTVIEEVSARSTGEGLRSFSGCCDITWTTISGRRD